MTLTHPRVGAPSTNSSVPREEVPPPPSRLIGLDSRRRLAASGLALLSGLALAFGGYVLALSPIQEHRAQVVSYVRLRNALALGTQPVTPPIPAGTPVALVQIPSLGLSEVVLEGTSGATLMAGPGHLRTSVLPGQAGVSVLFGRRAAFGAPFRLIGTLTRGSEILTTTGQGVARYVVTDVGQSRGTASLVRAATEPGYGQLVLVTAGGTPYLPAGVVYVDARLQVGTGSAVASGAPAGAPFPEGPPVAAVGPAEFILGSDTAAMLPLALWSQLLLVVVLALSVAWTRYGRPTTWLVGVPIVLAVGWHVAEATARLLPNVL